MMLEELKDALGPNCYDDLMAGIECLAEHDVELLVQARGNQRRPEQPLPCDGIEWPKEKVIKMAFVSTVLRLKYWHDAGHVRDLPMLLPVIEEAQSIATNLLAGYDSDAELDRAERFCVKVLVYWMKYFSWSARRNLGVDVVLSGGFSAAMDTEEIANFLLKHRGYVGGNGGCTDADS